jgi:ABC-type antimicrobial peptide transport system permease subunit
LWGVLALWIDLKNESILSHKIAQIFPLGGSSILIILITALIGALVGGFAGMAGSSLRIVKIKK